MSRLNAKPDLPASQMHATLRRLVESSKDVATLAGLSHHPTRFLYAGLLASIIKSDERAGPEELALYALMVPQKLLLPEAALEAKADFIAQGLSDEETAGTSRVLRRELPMEKRGELIGRLAVLALCDADLYPRKEEHVQRIVQFISVAGLRALAEKMNGAARKAQRDAEKIV
jgi:uncharacterized tellurite resistance protein B-like protein